MDNYKIFSTENNLKYCLIKNNFVNSVSVDVFIKVGSRDEEKQKNWGSSHLLEHSLFKSTKNRSNYNEISRELDCLGSYNGTTSQNLTNF